MAERREKLDILLQEEAEDQKALQALMQRIESRHKELDPEKDKRIAEENGYLGAIARVLVAEDTSLKRRFIQHGTKLYPPQNKRARRYLERVIGKFPAEPPIARHPAERDAAE